MLPQYPFGNATYPFQVGDMVRRRIKVVTAGPEDTASNGEFLRTLAMVASCVVVCTRPGLSGRRSSLEKHGSGLGAVGEETPAIRHVANKREKSHRPWRWKSLPRVLWLPRKPLFITGERQ